MYCNIFFKITKLNLKRLDSRIDMERIGKNRSFESLQSLEALRRRTASFAADGECTGAKNANFLLVDRRGMVGAWHGGAKECVFIQDWEEMAWYGLMILKPLLFIFNNYKIWEIWVHSRFFTHAIFGYFWGVRFASMAAFTISDRYPIQFMVVWCMCKRLLHFELTELTELTLA